MRVGGYGAMIGWYGWRALDSEEVDSRVRRARDQFLRERARAMDQFFRERARLVRQLAVKQRQLQHLTAMIDAGQKLVEALIASKEVVT